MTERYWLVRRSSNGHIVWSKTASNSKPRERWLGVELARYELDETQAKINLHSLQVLAEAGHLKQVETI